MRSAATFRRRPLIGVLLAILALLPSSVGGTEAMPVLAGRSTFVFEGASSVRVALPGAFTLTRDSFEVSVEGGEAAVLMFSPRNLPPATPYDCAAAFPEQSDGSGPGEEWCQEFTVVYMEGYQFGLHVFGATDEPVTAQVFDVYAVTDGVATVTVTTPDLAGDVSITATGLLDGALAKLPANCLVAAIDGCGHTATGGITFDDIMAPARFGSIVYAQRHNRYPVPPAPDDPPTPGFHNAGACIYPSASSPEASADVSDHPTGCDASDTGFLSNYGINAVLQTPLGVSLGHMRAEWVPMAGPRYAGFAANQFESTEPLGQPGRYGAYGYWFSRQISCPSGNWRDC